MEMWFVLVVDDRTNLVTNSIDDAIEAFRIVVEKVEDAAGDIDASLKVGWHSA